MDPRVFKVMQMLRKQALKPPPSKSDTTTQESDNKEEQKLSLEEMAFEVELSESRMRALFKSNLDLSPNQYVHQLKMKKAAKELSDTYKRVTKIATKLGFESNSHFTRSFKKAYGMTPTQYRKLHQRPSEGEEEGKNGASSSR